PFNYQFLRDVLNDQYKAEQQFAKIFSFFAVLAIFIACLGLWGLASFTTTLKLREIGIRKVLGASATSIVSLLSWQFCRLVLVASVIAIPLTWYGIDSWLDNFAFRTNLAWDLFVVPVAILTFLALGTVSVQIIRGASVNPARVLRSELVVIQSSMLRRFNLTHRLLVTRHRITRSWVRGAELRRRRGVFYGYGPFG